jgi:hypothetical protein
MYMLTSQMKGIASEYNIALHHDSIIKLQKQLLLFQCSDLRGISSFFPYNKAW